MKARRRTLRVRKIIMASFLIMIVLFFTFDSGSLRFVHAQQNAIESLSGWFTIIRGDSSKGTTAPHDMYMLATDDGKSISLLLDDQARKSVGGLLTLDRKRITVSGARMDSLAASSAPETFHVTSIATLQKMPAVSGSGQAAVSGSQPWISIMCKFSDIPDEPQNLSYFQGMYTGSYPGLDNYWREASYNLVNITGSSAAGWYIMPHPRSYYVSGGNVDLGNAVKDCTSAANPTVNFAGFVGVNLMFNAELNGFAYGGGWYLSLDGPSKFWDVTWIPPWGYNNLAVMAHEMGHGFGLPHSSDNTGQTYNNQWDVMSDTWSNCYRSSDITYGCLGQHTISYHKDILGWIPVSQKFTATWGSLTQITLEQLALPQTGNYKMAQIPIGGSSTHFYTVEARRQTGYDYKLPGEAVVIHEVDTSRDAPAHVVDIDNNGNTGDAGAMWTVGEVFRDNANSISIAVIGATATGFQVKIALGVTVYYVGGNAGVDGATINYTGGSTTTDNNGDYLFPVPAGWSGTVTPSKAGYGFSPTSRTYASVAADQFSQNYTAMPLYSISGGAGVSGVTFSYTDGMPKSVASESNGNYLLLVSSSWSGTVTPTHPCFTFSPINRTYSNVVGDVASQNYTPTFNNAAGCADINVWIGGTNRGRFGVQAQGSTRASFAGINNGPVKTASSNTVALIDAERVIYKVKNIQTSFTEMMGLPDSQLTTTYWLPWYNNVDLDTQLRFGNVSGATAHVHVYIGKDEMTGSPFTLQPGESTRQSFAGINDGPVKIDSDVNIVAAERVIYKVNGVQTSFSEMMALPNGQLNSTYWLPWYNNVDLDTQLRFGNVSSNPATVHVYIGTDEMPGSPFILQPGESTRQSFAGINNGPVRIDSDENIVAAERVIYKVNGVQTSFTEMMALPNSQLNSTYWLPWYNNVDLDTQLRFGNVSSNPASVHVYIGGAEVAGSPFTLQPGESTRQSFAGVNNGPVRIQGNVNIVVAERVIYKVKNVNTSFSEMMALPDSQLDTAYWLPWYNNVDLDTQLRFGVP